MVFRPSVLCPVDFSTASRGALRYGAAIAQHFQAKLSVLTVNDPLVAEAAAIRLGRDWLPQDSRQELQRFLDDTFGGQQPVDDVELLVETGKPAPEILRVATERRHDLIVMSSHGLTGIRKMFFGATTERVLRETHVPVLVTPPDDPGPMTLERAAASIGRILVPVDLSPATPRQVRIARGLAEALGVPILLAHVTAPVRFPGSPESALSDVERQRRSRAEAELESMAAAMRPAVDAETASVFGDPAEELARLARERNAGLIVMGLHASPGAGPRMGSVTYRVLTLTRTLVLALPPVFQADAGPAPAPAAGAAGA